MIEFEYSYDVDSNYVTITIEFETWRWSNTPDRIIRLMVAHPDVRSRWVRSHTGLLKTFGVAEFVGTPATLRQMDIAMSTSGLGFHWYDLQDTLQELEEMRRITRST